MSVPVPPTLPLFPVPVPGPLCGSAPEIDPLLLHTVTQPSPLISFCSNAFGALARRTTHPPVRAIESILREAFISLCYLATYACPPTPNSLPSACEPPPLLARFRDS